MTTRYLALGTFDDNTAFVECAYAGYARQPVVFLSMRDAFEGQRERIQFPAADGWPNTTALALFDALTGGNEILRYSLDIYAQDRRANFPFVLGPGQLLFSRVGLVLNTSFRNRVLSNGVFSADGNDLIVTVADNATLITPILSAYIEDRGVAAQPTLPTNPGGGSGGGGGGGDTRQRDYLFPTPLDTWVVNHGRGYFPDVNLYDVDGREFAANVQNVSVNKFIVGPLNPPMMGKVRLGD